MSIPPREAAQAHAKLLQALENAADKYAKPQDLTFTYGTAGFRTLGANMASVVFRVALLAVMRSQKLNGASIGVMITASHNPEPDNGVKLVDPAGEMLDQSWEPHATTLANCPTTGSLISTVTTLATHLHIDLTKPASIIYACDTRPSSPELVKALEAGLAAFGTTVSSVDLGVTTTPVLHYAVRATNSNPGSSPQTAEDEYLRMMSEVFRSLIAERSPLPPLYVDCANGVGAMVLVKLKALIGDILPIHILNDQISTPGALNSQCGADFVKTKQTLPPSVASAGILSSNAVRCCSLDGDADRLIYYYNKDGSQFRLLDGDKIACLVAMYFNDLVKMAGLSDAMPSVTRSDSVGDKSEGKGVGVVQTAYANGSSTKYLEQNGMSVTCVPTGVKHLHHAAQRYDVGVYFEANGHGTVLFSQDMLDSLTSISQSSHKNTQTINKILLFSTLVNQAVGDALSDMLLVETVLADRGWNNPDWDAMYEDLPNRLAKVEVPDRGSFETNDAERRLKAPIGLQEKVDEVVRKVEMGRAFVRPSGTEDCVRVYAEAKSQPEADLLAEQVADLVRSVG